MTPGADQELESLRVVITTAGRLIPDGVVESLDADAHALVRIPRGESLTLGDWVQLQFHLESVEGAASGLAIVESSRLATRGTLYGLRLDSPERFCRDAPRRMVSFLNRRGAFRVIPENPLNVTILAEGGMLLSATMRDISSTGAGLLLAPRQFIPSFTTEIHFRLPVRSRELRVPAQVRYQQCTEEGVQCGVQYDFEASDDALDLKAAIDHYVLMRHRQGASRGPRDWNGVPVDLA